MPATPKEIFERYVWTGALSRNAEALAELFTVDGVYEAPFVPPDGAFPRRLAGRAEIRDGMAAYYERLGSPEPVNMDASRYTLHTTADPEVFIAEIDTVLGSGQTMSLVQIFRVRDGKIASLRDYFAPETVS